MRKDKIDQSCACVDCPALCCKDLAIPTRAPNDENQRVELDWYLHFKHINVFYRSRKWFILVRTQCQYLDKHDLCTKYEERSETCRVHNPPECEKFGDFYDEIFENPEDLKAFLERRKQKRKKSRKRSNKRSG